MLGLTRRKMKLYATGFPFNTFLWQCGGKIVIRFSLTNRPAQLTEISEIFSLVPSQI